MKNIIQYINNHNLENKKFDEQTYSDLLNLCKIKWGNVKANYFNKALTDELIREERYLNEVILKISKDKNILCNNSTAVRINNIYKNLDSIKYKLTKEEIETIIYYYKFHDFLIREYLINNSGDKNIDRKKEKTKWCYVTIHHDKENIVQGLSEWFQNTEKHWNLGYQDKKNLTKLDWVIHTIVHHVINQVWDKQAKFVEYFKWYLIWYLSDKRKDNNTFQNNDWKKFIFTNEQISYLHYKYSDEDLKILLDFLNRKRRFNEN